MEILYRNGRLEIYIEKFFPCTKSKMNKLLAIIDLSEDRDKYREQLKYQLGAMINKAESEIRTAAKDYIDAKQKRADIREMINTERHPNGLPLWKSDLKLARAALDDMDGQVKRLIRTQNKLQNDIDALKELIRRLER